MPNSLIKMSPDYNELRSDLNGGIFHGNLPQKQKKPGNLAAPRLFRFDSSFTADDN